MLIVYRDEAPLVYCAPDASEDSHFGTFHIGTSTIRDCTTALFQVTMYRQFARKVGTSANSALIRYYLRRLKLSIARLAIASERTSSMVYAKRRRRYRKRVIEIRLITWLVSPIKTLNYCNKQIAKSKSDYHTTVASHNSETPCNYGVTWTTLHPICLFQFFLSLFHCYPCETRSSIISRTTKKAALFE